MGEPTPPPPRFGADDVGRYYDQNTRLFLRLGSSTGVQNIHRAVWVDGANTLEAALNTTNDMLACELGAAFGARAAVVADLGCGVGASLIHVLRALPQVTGIGATISGVQARIAAQHLAERGLADRASVAKADFQALPLADASLDAAYSIEAFCHAPSAQRYLAEAARVLRPGARLVICDDFLARDGGWSRREARWFGAYQDGWRVPNVRPLTAAADLAAGAGLRLLTMIDLTAHLRLRALPFGLAGGLLTLGRRLPLRHEIIPSMLGSMALQQCLKLGVIRYLFAVFVKDP